VEVKQAMKRCEEGTAQVIPVLLRSCLWEEAPFGKLSPLPADRVPVKECVFKDRAFKKVAGALWEAARTATSARR